MIDFAAKILVKALQDISSWDILDGRVSYDAIPLRQLQDIWYHSEGNMDETALARKLDYLKEWMDFQLQANRWKPDAGTEGYEDLPAVGIFDLVHCLASKLTTVSRGRMVYRYKYLKTWHYLTGKIGSNLFTASALAKRDYENNISRRDFLNTNILYHDNQVLNEVLDRGMSENHFHLHGSTPYFLLSWLSLMNSTVIARTSKLLDQINEEPRSPKIKYRYSCREDKFSIQHLKAAAVRVYLYACLTGQMIEFGEYHASPEWLLDYILDTELPYTGSFAEQMYCEGVMACEDESLREYLEHQFEENNMEYLDRYRGICWFFQECFPYIPLNALSLDRPLFGRENRRKITGYISRNYEPFALSRCAWLFHGKDFEKYRAEWMRQTRNALEHMLREPYAYDLGTMRQQVQQVIDSLHADSPREFKDYALGSIPPWDEDDWHQAVFFGERWLMYEMERRRFYKKKQENCDGHLYNLFYIYLVIKEAFRSELLQNNDKIGFRNFQAYERRKNWFTTTFTVAELARIAVESAFYSQKLEKLEIRVMPQKSCAENIRMIHGYDQVIGKIPKDCGEKEPDYYYVFHFRKEKDRIYRDGQYWCRHEMYRKKLEQLTGAVLSMRVKNPETAVRLKGIDACSSEDGCRPEVFAVVFRRLKQHTVYRSDKKQLLPQLRASYHVGEENQDVLDGLRAIDEAVYFLNLGSGDRLGHATMLGVNAGEWYQKNSYTVSIRQQDYLDNVVWLYHRMIHYHIANSDNLLKYLEHEFHRYFNRVYEDHISHAYNAGIMSRNADGRDRMHPLQFNIHNYYYAWELRGDDPRLYVNGFYDTKMLLEIQSDEQRMNPLLNPEKRYIAEAAVLYHTYHYNDDVRREGNKPVVVRIPRHMVNGIAFLQKAMQKDIAKKGIAIETNPSSNLMIGGLAGYDSHPIVSFHNKGLVSDASLLEDCSQIHVSINTDDLGVFTTTLYNEYTLMAYALENKTDREGCNVYKKDMVYDWIDRVREMGNAQSFSRKLMLGDTKETGLEQENDYGIQENIQ